MVTLKIGGYDVKSVTEDQGSGAKIMYPDLYNGLGLKPEDFTAYDLPLVSFDRKLLFQGAKFDFSYKQGQRW